MRLLEPGSVSTPARIFLEIPLIVVGLYLALEALLFAVLLVNPLHPVREYFRVMTVAGRPPAIPLGLWFAIDFPLGTIVAGLAVVVLAELFRAGADLQDDQALTV